jgi:hypothetical protein
MRTKPNGNFDFFDIGVERLLRVCTVLILFRWVLFRGATARGGSRLEKAVGGL